MGFSFRLFLVRLDRAHVAGHEPLMRALGRPLPAASHHSRLIFLQQAQRLPMTDMWVRAVISPCAIINISLLSVRPPVQSQSPAVPPKGLTVAEGGKHATATQHQTNQHQRWVAVLQRDAFKTMWLCEIYRKAVNHLSRPDMP